ncbi:hypothetical protein ACFYRY_29680 [Streptomyces sp. NPDC005263]
MLVTPGYLEEDRTNLAAWQVRAEALITMLWAVVDAAKATAPRRSAA